MRRRPDRRSRPADGARVPRWLNAVLIVVSLIFVVLMLGFFFGTRL